MKDILKIEHGVYRTETPETQSEEYIRSRLKDEDNIAQILTPHIWEFQRKVAEIVHGTVQNISSPKILEIGTGTGATTYEVLNALPDTTIVEAIDMNEPRLERCRVRLGELSKRVNFVLAEAADYLSTKEPNSYDCIVTAFSLHNLPIDSRLAIISEVYRVLSPSGVFIDADKHGVEDVPEDIRLFSEQIRAIREGFQSDSDFAERWIQHYAKDHEVDMPREKYLMYLQSLGFKAQLVFQKGLEIITVAQK